MFIAHGATKEVRVKDFLLNQSDGLFTLSTRKGEGFFGWPDGGNSHHPHALRHARVHFHLGAVGDHSEKGAAVLHEKLLLLDLEDLRFEKAVADVAREVRLEHALQ